MLVSEEWRGNGEVFLQEDIKTMVLRLVEGASKTETVSIRRCGETVSFLSDSGANRSMVNTAHLGCLQDSQDSKVTIQQATNKVSMNVTKGKLEFSMGKSVLLSIPAMGGVGGTTTENILAECDLLEAGNFTLVTEKSGIKVFSPSQVRLRGRPIAVGRRAGDKCTYFDL